MKSGFKAVLLASVACGMFATSASAEGFYIGADAGVSFPFSTKMKNNANHNQKEKINFDDGFVADAVLGYDFGNNIRGEFDFGYRNFDIDKIAGEKVKGSIDSFAFMGNVYYDFNNKSKFTPFVGVGAGLAYNKVDKKNDMSGSSTKPALQGMVGLAYNFTDSWSASIAYRYFTTFSQEAKYEGVKGKYNFETQEILFGVRYTFNVDKAKTYASSAPVADMPEYMIFFALNSYNITPEAKKTLEKVATEYKETGEVIHPEKVIVFLDEKLKKYKETMGFYSIVTSEIEEDDREIINRYHGLSRIEDSFRIIKSDLEGRPIYVWTEEHIKAHFLICFIALTIIRIIQYKILKYENKSTLNVDGWEQGITAEKIKEALNNFKACSDRKGTCMISKPSAYLEKIAKSLSIDITSLTTIDKINQLKNRVNKVQL